jgi:quinol monooxygenase YgiN
MLGGIAVSLWICSSMSSPSASLMRLLPPHRIPARGIIRTTVFGLIVRCELKSGSGGRFDELAADLLRAARQQHDGLVAISCHAVSGRADSRVFIEMYVDHVAFIEFGQRPEARRFAQERHALLAQPPRIDLLEDPVGGSFLFFGHQ